MSNLIDELDDAAVEVQQRELEASAASRHLRECKTELRKARVRLYTLAKELKTHQSQYPLFERIEVGTNGAATPDEHQRGPTIFPSPPAGEGARRADEGAIPAAKAPAKPRRPPARNVRP